MQLFNEDCIQGSENHIAPESVDLMICDPPFGIEESSFDKHYKRQKDNIFEGYVEAPNNYEQWTIKWLEQAHRILKPDGSMYLISGWSKLREVLNAAHEVGFNVINHIIWKFNFGVWTTTKYISSHYHILYMTAPKGKKPKPTFNGSCRFGNLDRELGRSLQNTDREDVWTINKDYAPGEKKNSNKLPNALIEKMVLYSSNPGDVVCDYFMGNFTTGYIAYGLGRQVIGFELNKESFNYHEPILKTLEFGGQLKNLRQVKDKVPENQGNKITEQERLSICSDYKALMLDGAKKKNAIAMLQEKYGRGKFAILNIVETILGDGSHTKVYQPK